MTNKKSVRTRGKLQLSRYFQELKEGDFVAISREQAVQSSFPERFQGLTGIVEGKRGKSYIVKIRDHNEYKSILIEPIHLKKIKRLKKHDNK
ncbi:MAG: 50S ribosomal protein L21e [Candidatus Nanoarchaeia archaeon]|nr:50S ribosomal protein L21e [Candidatus Nanoarchaeia archaeon]MDD5358087.1 50S ribosomal protein L21e [Candidatus Nanoarchaeia archaeon]MDD5589275.1 50S ribosomal protein L21e [Candidatus Nanoarchaeia archaeon]